MHPVMQTGIGRNQRNDRAFHFRQTFTNLTRARVVGKIRHRIEIVKRRNARITQLIRRTGVARQFRCIFECLLQHQMRHDGAVVRC